VSEHVTSTSLDPQIPSELSYPQQVYISKALVYLQYLDKEFYKQDKQGVAVVSPHVETDVFAFNALLYEVNSLISSYQASLKSRVDVLFGEREERGVCCSKW
jgi:hypothetical protein